MAIIVGWYKCGLRGELIQIRWFGGTRVEEMGTEYLELVSPVK
jgi:hypothetical protein